jgi:hypothetical protein
VRAEDILGRVAETYANVAEYGDTCELVMGDTRGKFRTSFVRSGRLLFDGELSTKGRTKRFTLDPMVSVELAVAELAGLTLGVAHTIPRLLLPKAIGGKSILDAPATLLRRADDRVEIVLTGSVPRRVVIDARTWMIVLHEQDISDETTLVASYKPGF